MLSAKIEPKFTENRIHRVFIDDQNIFLKFLLIDLWLIFVIFIYITIYKNKLAFPAHEIITS